MKKWNYKLFFLSIFSLITFLGFSQEKAQLQKSKENIQKEINRITLELKKNKTEKLSFEKKIKLLRNKIKYRQEIIDIINADIKKTSNNIITETKAIAVIENDLKKLKDQFSKTLQSAQKQHATPNNWVFLLNAQNLHDAYKRYYYLKQYGDYQKQQKTAMLDTKTDLDLKIINLEKQKSKQINLKKNNIAQKAELVEDSKVLDKFLEQNKNKEQDLRSQITKKIKERTALDNKIKLIIKKEREKRRKANTKNKVKNTAKKSVNFIDLPETKLVSKNFEKNKGLLPWPVNKGEIKNKFGKHRHPTLPNITLSFNGIEISTYKNQEVKAVFNGKATYIFPLPNGTKCVILRHGKYVSIYANLKDVNVRVNQKVKTGDVIGSVFGTSNKNAILDFQIWKETKNSEIKVNPETWLKRR